MWHANIGRFVLLSSDFDFPGVTCSYIMHETGCCSGVDCSYPHTM